MIVRMPVRETHMRRKARIGAAVTACMAAVAATVLGTTPAVAGHSYGAQGVCSYAYGSSGANLNVSCVRMANNKSHAVAFAGLGNQ